MTPEEKGIQAIIFLQAMVGITETPAQAQAGWASMGKGSKRATLDTYKALAPKQGAA